MQRVLAMPRKFRAFVFSMLLVLSYEADAKKLKCTSEDRDGTDIGTNLPKKFEPSDAVWDPRTQSLYVVSDEGELAQLDYEGTLLNAWQVQAELDLEGCTIVPDRPGFVYLGVEAPAEIREFDVKLGKVTRTWSLEEFGTSAKQARSAAWSALLRGPGGDSRQDGQRGSNGVDGMEAITFVKNRLSVEGGFFFVGWQTIALIQIFEIDVHGKLEDGPVKYRGFIEPPGPGSDLAAMNVHDNKLYLLFDMHRTMLALDLTDPRFVPAPGEFLETYAMRDKVPLWTFDRIGNEGLAFGFVRRAAHELFLFLTEDPHSPEKTVRRYEGSKLDACFL